MIIDNLLNDISLSQEEVIDLEASERADRATRKKLRRRQLKVSGEFYPAVPGAWIETAGRLPGKAAHVAMVLWRKAALQGSARVSLTTDDLIPWGVGGEAKRSVLQAMEEAGLISVERRRGANPVVTIIRDGGQVWGW
jgi:hypothetical protein